MRQTPSIVIKNRLGIHARARFMAAPQIARGQSVEKEEIAKGEESKID